MYITVYVHVAYLQRMHTGVCEQTHSCCASFRLAKQKLQSSPWFGAPKLYLPACPLLRRTVFSQTPVPCSEPHENIGFPYIWCRTPLQVEGYLYILHWRAPKPPSHCSTERRITWSLLKFIPVADPVAYPDKVITFTQRAYWCTPILYMVATVPQRGIRKTKRCLKRGSKVVCWLDPPFRIPLRGTMNVHTVSLCAKARSAELAEVCRLLPRGPSGASPHRQRRRSAGDAEIDSQDSFDPKP